MFVCEHGLYKCVQIYISTGMYEYGCTGIHIKKTPCCIYGCLCVCIYGCMCIYRWACIYAKIQDVMCMYAWVDMRVCTRINHLS